MRVTVEEMQRLFVIAAIAIATLSSTVRAQDAKPFLGRWDMTVTPAQGTSYPQWMELVEKDGKIEGRVQPRGGGWRPIRGATVEAGKIIIALAGAGQGPAVTWELTSPAKDKITGIEKRGDTNGPALAGVRAPKLDRPMPK